MQRLRRARLAERTARRRTQHLQVAVASETPAMDIGAARADVSVQHQAADPPHALMQAHALLHGEPHWVSSMFQ